MYGDQTYTFKAKHQGKVQHIILHKEMQLADFMTSFTALQYMSEFPEGNILGFKDGHGQFIPPSLICQKPECFTSETYEIIIKPNGVTHHASSTTNGQPLSESDETRQTQTAQFSNSRPNVHGLQNLTTLGGNVTGQTASNYGSSRHNIFEEAPSQRVTDNGTAQRSKGASGRMQMESHMSPSQGIGYGLRMAGQQTFANEPSPTQFFNQSPSLEDTELIQVVCGLPSEIFEDSLKDKIITLLKQKDKGVRGALISFQDDNDFIALRNRIIHKVMATGQNLPSSANTAGFQQYPGTAVGRSRRRIGNYSDRYMPIIIDLESKQLLDEQTASTIKTLVHQENVDVQQVLNTYINRVIKDVELAYKLAALAQSLGAYLERPQSPLPKRKQELMNQINMLAQYHFRDPDDVQLLTKLVHDENELILAIFDHFESDNDRENLIDSLQRILNKSKTMGIHMQSITASSFYNNDTAWNRSTFQQDRNRASQTLNASNSNLGHGGNQKSQAPLMVSQMAANQMRATTPTGNYRNRLNQRPNASQYDDGTGAHLNNRYNGERPPTTMSQRFHPQQRYINFENHEVDYEQFQPATTVHDVEVIPGYFSSGEEDQVAAQQHNNYNLMHQRQQYQQRSKNYPIGHPANVFQSKYQHPMFSDGNENYNLGGVSPTRHLMHQHNGGQAYMPKLFKQSQISQNQFQAHQKTPNYSVSGNQLSNHTGQQYSHMHQSLEAEEMEPIYDDIGEAILIKDGIKMQESQQNFARNGFAMGQDPRRQIVGGVNHVRSSSSDYLIPNGQRTNPHVKQAAYYNFGAKKMGQEKARSGATSIARNSHKLMNISEDAQIEFVHGQMQNPGTFGGLGSAEQMNEARPGSYYNYGTAADFNMSKKFSAPMMSPEQQMQQSNKKKDKKQKKEKDKKAGKKDKKKVKKGKKRSRSSSVDSSTSSASLSSSSSSDSSSSSNSSDSSKSSSSSSSKSSLSNSKKLRKSRKDKKDKKKSKLVKKDKKEKGKKDKKKEKDESSAKASKKDKKQKKEKDKKAGKKDKKKGKKPAKSEESDADFERDEASEFPSKEQILQIVQDEDFEGNFRVDTFTFLDNAIRLGPSDDLKAIFKVKDQNQLYSQVMQASEKMFKDFAAANFSQEEITQLNKLRRSRSTSYRDAFLIYRRTGDLDELVYKLQKVIMDDGRDSQSANANDQQVVQKKSKAEQIQDAFNMIMDSHFQNNEHGQVLRNIFDEDQEERGAQLKSFLESFLEHNDRERLAAELTNLAMEASAQKSETFGSMQEAIDFFVQKGEFTADQGSHVIQLYQDGHKRIIPIWRVYKAIKCKEDMLHTLKVFLNIKGNNSAQPAAPAQPRAQAQNAAPAPVQNMSQGAGFSGVGQGPAIGGGFLRLNMMGGNDDNASNENQQNDKNSPNAGEIIDGGMDDQNEDFGECKQSDDDINSEEDTNQAAARLDQICRYSHKILKKYVVNGMITLTDGPQLHNLVDARDYRIICILEVYSQNKNEDDFLENLGLLTQVIKEQKELDEKSNCSNTGSFEENSAHGEINATEAEEQNQNEDSFTMTIKQAIQLGHLTQQAATWSINERLQENRQLKFTYNAFKKNGDLTDFANSLVRLHTKASK